MEIWKTIDDYPDYEVSNFGNVRRREFFNAKGELVQPRILRPRVRKDGYVQATLCKDGKHETVLVHRLVAAAFLQHTEAENTVHHIDGNRSNNAVENLTWMSKAEHLKIGDRTKKSGLARRKPVAMYTLDGEFQCIWASASIAEAVLGFNRGHISDCCRKCPGRKSCGGYAWRFADDEE